MGIDQLTLVKSCRQSGILSLCKYTSYTTSTEMTAHRIAFYELSSDEFFWGGYNFIKLVRLG